jgi:pyruvate,water dikinase
MKAGINVPKYVYFHTDELHEGQILDTVSRHFELDVQFFAVRSSAASEDSDKEAKAGQFYTALGVPKESIFREMSNVKDSFKGESGTIIVQEFVPSSRAGVMFTNAGMGLTAINANFGLCDTVVKGEACDQFILNSGGKLISKTINAKRPQFFTDGMIVESADDVEKQSLSMDDLSKLHQMANRVENHFGKPQDVEFCFKNDELVLLQSRPITRKIFTDVEYFDGANIQESFNGNVATLTYTMAKYGFPFAYCQGLENIGVRRVDIEKNRHLFENLLFSFKGRIYYRMNNWYQMLGFIPGNYVKKNFESMITANVKESIEMNIKPIPKLRFLWKSFIEYMRIDGRVSRLIDEANTAINEFQKVDLKGMSYAECIQLLRIYHDQFLTQWFIIGDNDFCVSFYYGKLKGKFSETELAGLLSVESASTKQIDDFKMVADQVKSNEGLYAAVKDGNRDRFEQELNNDIKTKAVLNEYFRKYGGRFANELKLETIDIKDDFKTLAGMILAYDRYAGKVVSNHGAGSDESIMTLSDRWNVRKFKKHAVHRENMRMVRSNFFGVMRQIFTEIGIKLHADGMLEHPRDIFHCDFLTIYNAKTLDDLPENIEFRSVAERLEYEKNDSLDPPVSFVVINGRFPDLDLQTDTQNLDHRSYQGIGSCNGIVTGRVRIFNEFHIPAEPFDILVAKSTDPGWTSLIALAKGMIIQNGGILSHAAIVSREKGIPTVINVKNATKWLKDGQLVELNGSTGEVKILA